MTLEELKTRIDKYGEMWGCRNETDDPTLLGWITVTRRKFSAFTTLDPQEEPERFAEWHTRKNDVNARPYFVSVYEVDAEAYEAETNGSINYMGPEDYGKRDNFYLHSLDELPDLLKGFGKSLDDLLPQRELDAP